MVETLTTPFAVAMKAMNKVASHINEMQKIHEEFGAVFDQLITEQSGEKKEVCWTNGVLSTKASTVQIWAPALNQPQTDLCFFILPGC